MANARGKAIDNTHLSIDQAEKRGFIHRDYIAHCLRWSHVAKYLQQSGRYKDAVVFDIGCGKDLPLARLLHTSRIAPKCYIGIDYNKQLNTHDHNFGSASVHYFGGQDFPSTCTASKSGLHLKVAEGFTGPLPTVITCFEVLEHVEPAHARAMVRKIAELLALTPNSVAFISTPNWDPKVGAADNHVNEMRYEALWYLFETEGLRVDDHWGTFASQKDYKLADYASGERFGDDGYGGAAVLDELWRELSSYYDSNYLSTVFAPLFPSKARNCLWQLSVNKEPHIPTFMSDTIQTPWTSSDKWEELKHAGANVQHPRRAGSGGKAKAAKKTRS